MTWQAPDNGGSPLTGYTVTATPQPQASALRTLASTTSSSAIVLPVAPTATSAKLQNLVGGVAYTISVVARNQYGASQAAVATITLPVDVTRPTVTAAALPLVTLGATTALAYTGSDAGSGIASYDVRYRRAAFSAGFSAMTYPTAWQGTGARSVSLGSVKGSTTCLSVRSRDRAGNLSPWSVERCTAVPLDDRSLAASSGWARSTGTAYYAGTVTTIARSGAVLTRTGVQTRRLSLVATTCPGCGTVGVYWNGVLQRQVNLNASTTTRRRVLTVADLGTVRSGTVTIRTLNAGRVWLDGLGLSRT